MINCVDQWTLDPTGVQDNAPFLTNMAVDLASRKYQPKVVFPEGIYNVSVWPQMMINRLHLEAQGEVHLHHTGTGEFIRFGALDSFPNPTIQPGAENMTFAGFIVEPSLVSGDGVVINAHRGVFDFEVVAPKGASTNPFAAISLQFSIITHLHPKISGSAYIGLMLDAWPNHPELCTTACTIDEPKIEGPVYGAFLRYGGNNYFRGSGTIESCGTGIYVDSAGNNHFLSIEMESNSIDIVTSGKAHDNLFWRCCGARNPKTNIGGFNNLVVNGVLTDVFGL